MSIDLSLVNSIQFGSYEEPATESLESLEKLNQTKDQIITSSMQTYLMTMIKPIYSGSQKSIDPLSMRPKDFIGPLEYVLLPDSLDRRILQIAVETLRTPTKFFAFILNIPNIQIVKPFNPSDKIEFSETSIATDCVHEAFQDEDFYKQSLGCFTTHKIIRTFALKVRNPMSFLACMGYLEVQKPSLNDVIAYFTNTPEQTKLKKQRITCREISYVIHYARICEIKEDGTIFVRSKFGPDGGVYQHRFDLVPYYFGYSYLIYSKNKQRDSI
jgi:hypothetical protein